MQPELLEQLSQAGYQGRVVSIQHLRDLKHEIETRQSDGLLDNTFFDECLSVLDFSLPEKLPDARSLIVVAVKQSQIRFTFTWSRSPAFRIAAGWIRSNARSLTREVQ